jgi:glycosyltransferase involved in cell wall biosynthesis
MHADEARCVRTAIVIPAFNHQEALDAVVERIPDFHQVFVVDDGSRPALRVARGHLLRHDVNRGYGAVQKTGYRAALDAGAERILLLHGDAQYAVADVLALARDLETADAVLGTRFASNPPNRVPPWRALGIRVLAKAANLRFKARFQDLHNGARAFRASVLEGLPFETWSDGFLFDQQMVIALLAAGARVVERPVAMTYEDVSSISPAEALRYGLGCLALLATALSSGPSTGSH